MSRKIVFRVFMIFMLLLPAIPFMSHSLTWNEVKAFTNQVIRRGAVGEDVVELQSRLKYIGYYNGKVDGAFGWGTYWGLRNFQEQFGIPVDGIAGEVTKAKLVKVTKYDANSSGSSGSSSTNVPAGYSQNDIKLMANAVYGEARGEPYEGQVAVAAVILNRVQHSSFPNSVASVIYQPGAFTAVADGQINLTPNDTARKAVLDAINGWDPTGNCIYYFNPDTATSKWIWGRPQVMTIGQHIFCK